VINSHLLNTGLTATELQ